MKFQIPLYKQDFTAEPRTIARSEGFSVTAFRYQTGIESLIVENSRGYVELLPFMGQIIWDAKFDDRSLRMDNMFDEPRPAKEIVDTYGCFAFHSGLLAAGCPAAEDDHPLHGEFACAPMQSAWLQISDDEVAVFSTYTYVQGFGHHYTATPSVVMRKGSAQFDIRLDVTNESKYQPMPLQYMCHMNYAFVPNATMTSNLPDDAFQLRRSVPDHVTPTPQWTQLNEDILAGKMDANSLVGAEAFDPEIVYFADDLPQYGERAKFAMTAPDGTTFTTQFDSADFPVATRWILHNEDQKVAAFALPGTSRPEGRCAARDAGTLIELQAGERRSFCVTTGIKE